MIVIEKKQIEKNGELVYIPNRLLTKEEKKRVIYTVSNETSYIYYEKGDTLPIIEENEGESE